MTMKTTTTTTAKPSKFKICYSYALEDLNMRFFGNIDRIITFAQLLGGTAVISSFGNITFVGFVITVLSIASFIISPAVKSERSMQQRLRYTDLFSSLDDDDLGAQFEIVQKSDSICLGIFNNVAYIRAGLMSNMDVSKKRLTIIERIAAFIAGDSLYDIYNK